MAESAFVVLVVTVVTPESSCGKQTEEADLSKFATKA